MGLPNFFVIGAAKSGTTALWRAVSQHPEVFMSAVKEPRHYTGGCDAGTYRSLFADTGGARAIGEASGVYLWSADAARRIAADVPDAKLVAVLRQPAERAHAHFWHRVRTGHERARSFEEALAVEATLDPRTAEPWRFYRGRGMYHAQLSAYLDHFPAEQLRLCLYEDWRDRREEVLRDLFTFLGVDPAFVPTRGRHNVSHAVRSPPLHRLALRTGSARAARLDRRLNAIPVPAPRPSTTAELLDGFRADVDRLQGLMRRDLSHWLVTVPSLCCAPHGRDRRVEGVHDDRHRGHDYS